MKHNGFGTRVIPAAGVILLSLFLFHLPRTPAAFACSCVPPGPPQEELRKSTAVFTGRVDRIDRFVVASTGEEVSFIVVRAFEDVKSLQFEKLLSYGVAITLDIGETWKGVSGGTIALLGGAGGGDCGYDFREGERYIVYAYTSLAYGEPTLGTSICTRTRLLADADTDLASLGEGVAPTPPADTGAEETQAIPVPIMVIVAVLVVAGLGRILYKLFQDRQSTES